MCVIQFSLADTHQFKARRNIKRDQSHNIADCGEHLTGLGDRQSEHKAGLRSRLRVSSHREVEVRCVGIYSDKPAA